MNNSKDILDRLEKLEFQVQLIAESLDFSQSPIASLVIGFNWSEADLDKAHDIFDKYDQKLVKKESISWVQFEREFEKELRIGYQSLKMVVLAFYRNAQWSGVCFEYASHFGNTVPLELKSIVRDDLR